jgi:hypothetical protein
MYDVIMQSRFHTVILIRFGGALSLTYNSVGHALYLLLTILLYASVL